MTSMCKVHKTISVPLTLSQAQGFKKPPSNRRLNAKLWNMIQALQREFDQQRQDAKNRENSLGIQLEQQRKESEQERKGLQVQQKTGRTNRKSLWMY